MSPSSKRTSTTTSVNAKRPDALQLLKRDDAEVKKLFDRFEKLGADGPREKKGAAREEGRHRTRSLREAYGACDISN